MPHFATPEKDALLALAVASGKSISAIADEANLDRGTIHRKLENPNFCRQVAEFRDQLIGTALGRMTDNMTRAADALAQLLDAPEAHIRLRAIRLLFTMGIRLRDSIDLSSRVRALEADIENKLGAQP